MNHCLVDTCVNLTDESFIGNEDKIIDNAKKNNVKKLVLIGNNLESSQSSLKLAQKYNFISSVGYHPHNAREWSKGSFQKLMKLSSFKEVKAIGECGLDNHRDHSSPETQIKVFMNHISLAKETQLPLYIHERDAFDQMYSILKNHLASCSRAVIHCFTGSENSLIDYLDLGLYIGQTGWICDDRRGKHLREFINLIPDDKLLIETDSPYLSPYITSEDKNVNSRMRYNNEPAYLVEIAKEIAKYRGQTYEHICNITFENYIKFFEA